MLTLLPRYFWILAITLMVCWNTGAAFAAGAIQSWSKTGLTTNVAATALPNAMIDTYLYEVRIVSSADDAITVTIADSSGTIWTGTSASATSGEYLDTVSGGAFRLITPGSTIAISDFAGGGTADIIVSSVD